MGIVLSMLVAVTSVMPAQLPLDIPPVPVLSNADAVRHIEFDLDIASFARQRFSMRRQYPTLDWTTDGCSAPIVGS